jgi:monoamine oxidase
MGSQEVFDVVIIGAGLSGLCLANRLVGSSALVTRRGFFKVKVLEASGRLGGRLANNESTVDPKIHNTIDMGGAWIWPRHQPFLRDLVAELAVPTFPQPDDPSSTRMEGGAVQLIHQLAQRVREGVDDSCAAESRIELNSNVVACKLVIAPSRLAGHATAALPRDETIVQVTTADKKQYLSRTVVFAIPPKLLVEKVSFDPPLSRGKQMALEGCRTWMAGVTKVALIYRTKFWDRRYSNMGVPSSDDTEPAFQVYDSGTRDGTVHALTFFTHVAPLSTAQTDDSLLAKQVAKQMKTVWNRMGKVDIAEAAESYIQFAVYRWPRNEFISGDDSYPDRINPHPSPVAALAEPEWGGRLLFAGTETDPNSPGVMEGAIGAAIRVSESLNERDV